LCGLAGYVSLESNVICPKWIKVVIRKSKITICAVACAQRENSRVASCSCQPIDRTSIDLNCGREMVRSAPRITVCGQGNWVAMNANFQDFLGGRHPCLTIQNISVEQIPQPQQQADRYGPGGCLLALVRENYNLARGSTRTMSRFSPFGWGSSGFYS